MTRTGPNTRTLGHIQTFESFGLARVYHATSRESLPDLLRGVDTARAARWGQWPGLFVSPQGLG